MIFFTNILLKFHQINLFHLIFYLNFKVKQKFHETDNYYF